jgi:hypothetical protein
MGRHLAVGASSFARNPRFDDGANEFAPTRAPRDIPVEASGRNREKTALVLRIVGANSFAPLAARIQPNLEELRM